MFIDARLAAGHVAFPLADLAKETGMSVTAAKNQLRRLGSLVVRVSRLQQFFLIVSPEHRAMGAPPVTRWLNDYFSWLGHSYYLALQSAAGTYGSNPQALQVTQVMTDGSRREIEVGRLRVRFFVKRGIEQTPTQPLANAFAPTRVSTPEATAFDLVRYASRIGGIGRAVETLTPLLPLMGGSELKRMLDAENEPATAQRLGYIIEPAGICAHAISFQRFQGCLLNPVHSCIGIIRKSDCTLYYKYSFECRKLYRDHHDHRHHR